MPEMGQRFSHFLGKNFSSNASHLNVDGKKYFTRGETTCDVVKIALVIECRERRHRKRMKERKVERKRKKERKVERREKIAVSPTVLIFA